MKAVIFKGNGTIDIEEVPVPAISTGMVLVRHRASALCGSDLSSYLSADGLTKTKYMNNGHEMAGEIVAVDGTKHLKVNNRVTVNIMSGCGRCYYCSIGEPKFCSSLDYLLDCHAEYIALPEEACMVLPDDISFETGVLLGGDTIGVAYRTMKRLAIKATDTVLIIGAGPIGIGMTFLAKFLGARIIAVEKSEYRRRFISTLGADAVIDPSKQDVKAEVQRYTESIGVPITIECSGSQEGELLAIECTKNMGTVVLVGENHNLLSINPSDQIIHKELTIIGSWYFNKDDYSQILSLYRQGLNPDKLVTHKFKLEQAGEAYEEFANKKTGKVLLVSE